MSKLAHAFVLTGLVAMPALATAADASPHSVTGNLGFFSDYAFRGVSQTDEDPAIQGGFDYAHASGFYLGTWGSNVEFADANMEWDIYGGYKGKIGGDLGFDVGLLQYFYPGFSDADTLEAYGALSYKGFGLKASYSTTDYFGAPDSDGTVYWDASFNYELPAAVMLGLHYGYTTGEGAQDDYADYKVSVAKSFDGFNVGLAYVATDDDGEDLYGDYADDRFIVSVGKTF
ncbi:MAG: TorF family putative porin [Thiobacillus sp.]|uniref:TorF family putative porin n=1 Tax=Thiobacillus sp. TaxID=924 RepID=UPI002893B549|nr:TorF family putative porin [Thiobacillus sp.]MDT3706930.1 TorF family putative porin [Thiobacillus sp.]